MPFAIGARAQLMIYVLPSLLHKRYLCPTAWPVRKPLGTSALQTLTNGKLPPIQHRVRAGRCIGSVGEAPLDTSRVLLPRSQISGACSICLPEGEPLRRYTH